MILKGNLVADWLYDDRPEVKEAPTLFVKIGEGEDNESYLHSILRASDKWGVKVQVVKRMEDVSERAPFIILDDEKVRNISRIMGDVDGRHSVSLSDCLLSGRKNFHTPCTPEAIVEFLDFYDIPIEGRSVCIVGRGDKVGKPLAAMLMRRNATVTVCHSKTPEATLRHNLLNADIIIEGSGKKDLFGASDIRCGSVVINVGGGFSEPQGDFRSFTLVPFIGGIGPVTTAILMTHVLAFQMWREKIKE